MDKLKEIVSQIESLNVAELAELVKTIEEKFGITAGALVVGGVAAADSKAEEKTSFNVLLQSAGEQKINVIKVVREITGLGLKEAKDLVEGAPKIAKEGVKKEEAEEIKKKFESVGAVVVLQ